ncbi:MAG: hypothetical protein P1V51_17375 [Deltaproteobacteria bacterium]|nr:hypothetical protein [Deltaproteobacteria bacterium]
MREFLTQEVPAYRDFQLVYGLLFLNFAIPVMGYVFSPETAIQSYRDTNLLLGGGPLPFPESQSVFFWVLGCANVLTLAFCCAFLMWNLRRHYAALLPLTFLKFMAATLWLAIFLLDERAPIHLGAALLDYVTCAAFVFFARRARRAIGEVPDEALVPRPRAAFGGA